MTALTPADPAERAWHACTARSPLRWRVAGTRSPDRVRRLPRWPDLHAPARGRRLGRFLDGLPCQRPRDTPPATGPGQCNLCRWRPGACRDFPRYPVPGRRSDPGRADRGNPAGTVRPGARENHGSRQGTSIGRERIQELVDHRRRAGSRRAGSQPQSATGNRQHGTGRDDINVARIHGLPIRGLAHGHRGCAPQQPRELARVGGIQVLDDDERKVGRWRKRAQQPAAGLEAPRRRADSDNRRVTHYRLSQMRSAHRPGRPIPPPAVEWASQRPVIGTHRMSLPGCTRKN